MSLLPARCALALCGLAAVPGAAALALLLGVDLPWPVAVGGVAGLLVLPCLRRWLVGNVRGSPGLRQGLTFALLALQVALALTLALGLHSLLALGLTVLLYLQGECLGEARHPTPVAVVVAASLIEVHVAVDRLESPLAALLYLVAVGLAPVALVVAPALLGREGWSLGVLLRRAALGLLLGLLALALALGFHEVASPTPVATAAEVERSQPPPPAPTPPPRSPEETLRPQEPSPRSDPGEDRSSRDAAESETDPSGPAVPPGEAIGRWARGLLDRVGTLLRGEPERATLGEVGRSIFTGPTVGGEPYLRYPLGLYLGILSQLVLVLLVLRAFRRRRRRRLELVHRPGVFTPLARLLRALEGYGHRREPSQTLQELVTLVTVRRGLPFRPLNRVAEILNRARFGGEEVTPQEHDFLEEFLRRVEDHSVV